MIAVSTFGFRRPASKHSQSDVRERRVILANRESEAPERDEPLWISSIALACRVSGPFRLQDHAPTPCLVHIIVLSERHLRRILTTYFIYYHGSRTHLSLKKDTPTPRRQRAVTEGEVVGFPEIGGLHHRYERRSA